MHLHVLKRWIKVRWNKPSVRIIIAVTTLIAVIIVEYYLVNIPAPVDVNAVSPKITPKSVASRSQRLLIENPVLSPAGILASHIGRKHEIVDAHFDRARVSEETRDLNRPIRTAPREEQPIDFFNRDLTATATDTRRPRTGEGELTPEEERKAGEDTCRTDIQLNWSKSSGSPRTLSFYQEDALGLSSSSRSIEMEASGAELTITLNTMIPPSSDPEGKTKAPGCAKLLRVGTWKLDISAPREIKVVAVPGSSFRFIFSTDTPASIGNGKSVEFEPFAFEPKPFYVQALSVVPEGDSPKVPSLRVSERTGRSLVMNKLSVGSDELLVDYSGEGMVQQNGELMTIDLLDRLKRYPIIGAVLAMANTAILGWFVFILRGIHRGST